jgi:hypothetical protein
MVMTGKYRGAHTTLTHDGPFPCVPLKTSSTQNLIVILPDDFTLDTQGQIAYIPVLKKGLLITLK